MPIVPKQSFIEYFLQDAQITGIIQVEWKHESRFM